MSQQIDISCGKNFNFRTLGDQLWAKQLRTLKRQLTLATKEILKRTQAGQDVDGAAFAKYTEAYAAWKFGSKRSGGAGRGGYSKGQMAKMPGATFATKGGKASSKMSGWGVPNLTLTQRMLNAMTSDAQDTGGAIEGRIFFNSALEAAKARGNMRKRNFFGLSKDQIETLIQKLNNAQ